MRDSSKMNYMRSNQRETVWAELLSKDLKSSMEIKQLSS